MPDNETDLHSKTMAQLADEAHRAGIDFVAHMSFTELIEAIEQQRETNALHTPRPRAPGDHTETTPG